MKNYEASRNIDGTYDIYGSDDNWYSQSLEASNVRGCCIKSCIRKLYARDTERLAATLKSCYPEKTLDQWFEAVGL